MTTVVFDDDASSHLEQVYRIRDAVRRRALAREALGASPGERILDIGCGPGFYCAELAEAVGLEGSVVGVDGSASMLALAARRCEGLGNVDLLEGDASSLPVANAEFDAALCVQVMEYVTDTAHGLAEMYRVLRPGGRLLVWDVDWATASLHSEDPARMDRVLAAWDEHLIHPSLPRTLGPQLRAAGFTDVEMTAHAFATIDFDPDESYGAALIGFIGGFVIGHNGITAEEAGAWVAEQQDLGARGEFSFAVTQFCFTARRPLEH